MVWTAVAAGEKAKNKRAAMMPTGKRRSISGGGGRGGNTRGSTTMNAARAASTRTVPKPVAHLTMLLQPPCPVSEIVSPPFSFRNGFNFPVKLSMMERDRAIKNKKKN
ncbi:hypothetical protein NL676_036783 [Syzygium grande]|nr:hypothetical protein NL676_036783 [Syzygium grande]